MKHILSLFLVALMAMAVAGCSSCGGGSGTKKATTFDTIPAVTKADTERVFNNTAQFMELLKTNQVDSALNLLYEDVEGKPFPLIDSVRTKYRQQFRRFPVLDYKLVTSEITRSRYATATYEYRFMDNPTDDPAFPCSIRLTIEERLMDGDYRLILHNYKELSLAK